METLYMGTETKIVPNHDDTKVRYTSSNTLEEHSTCRVLFFPFLICFTCLNMSDSSLLKRSVLVGVVS